MHPCLGGAYYLPEDTCDAWFRIVNAVEHASDTIVTTARIILDDSAIRTIRNSLVREIDAQCEKLETEIANNTDLGERALENRQQFGRDLLEKVQMYEDILGQHLGQARSALQRVAQTASAAGAKKRVAEDFDDTLDV